MATWPDLLLREGLTLGLLAGLGAGPVAFLRGTQAGTRLALAPAFGLALGAAALFSVGQLISLGTAAWVVLLPMLVISLTLCVIVQRRGAAEGESASGLATGLRLGLPVAVVLVALSYPLAHRDSLGPVAYRVSDAALYVALADRLESHSVPDDSVGPPWDLTSTYGTGGVRDPVNPVGVSTLQASSNSLLGWRAAETQSTWMIALVAAIALGAFAAVQELTASRTWAAPLAGALMAGPFAYQLFVDGSQGALSLLVLFPALAVLASRVVERPPGWELVLVALLLAGAVSLYPVLMPMLAAWAIVILGAVGVAAARQGRLERAVLWRTAGLAVAVAVMAMAMAPAAVARAVDFYSGYVPHRYDASGVVYELPVWVIPSWLLQIRELYGIQDNFARDAAPPLTETLLVPAVLLAAFGIARYRRAWVVAVVVPVAAILAYYSFLRNENPDTDVYSANRSLLILGVAGGILISIGIAALAADRNGKLRALGVAVAVVVVGLAVVNSRNLAHRALEGGQILPGSVREALPELNGREGVLLLEGAGARYPDAALEMPGVYNLVNDATPNQLSMDVSADDHGGPVYLGGTRPLGPWFDPGYEWVMTLVPGVDSGREPVARFDGVAVQRRTRPLDVTVAGGIATDPSWRDPDGSAWIMGDLLLLVSGAPTGPVWVKLELEGQPVQAALPPGARIGSRSQGRQAVCVPVGGSGPIREVGVGLRFASLPPVEPSGYASPAPNRSLRLAGMWAARRCGA